MRKESKRIVMVREFLVPISYHHQLTPRQPDTLRCLPQQSVSTFAATGISPVAVQTRRCCTAPTINHHVSRVSMTPDVADKIDAHAAGTLVAKIAIEAEGPEMTLEFPSEDGR